MIVTQNLSRDIVETHELSFDSFIVKNNTTGLFSLGFSGAASLTLTLQSGFLSVGDTKLYSYSTDEQINISGQIGKNSYDIFVNNDPIILGTPREEGQLNKVVLTCNKCSVDFDLFVDTPPFPIYLLDGTFYISGQSGIEGAISSTKRFVIFSGSPPTTNAPYSFSGFTTGLSTSHTFTISRLTDNYADYSMPISLYTSMGQVDFIYTITGKPPNQNYFVTAFSPPSFTYNGDTINYYYQILSSTGYNLNVSLYPVSGTGQFYGSIFATGDFHSHPITGGLTGSGSIRQYYPTTGTGYNSDQQLITGQFSGFVETTHTHFATGLMTGRLFVTGSGLGTGIGYSGIATGYLNYGPVFTINQGSGTYTFASAEVTGDASGTVYKIHTLDPLIATSIYSGRFSGIATGTGIYISTGTLSSNYPTGNMTGLDYTKTFSGSWELLTGVDSFNLASYWPHSLVDENSYTKSLATFPKTMDSISISVIHSVKGVDNDIANLIISGSDYKSYLLTGNN